MSSSICSRSNSHSVRYRFGSRGSSPLSSLLLSACAPEKMTLEDVIAKLDAHGELDDLGKHILAAAITLRDSTGRDRLPDLRRMCRAWGVDRQEKIDGKWQNRGCTFLRRCSARRLAWPLHDGNQISMVKRSRTVLQNTPQPALAARPRLMECAELGERMSEYTRETTRVHLRQARQTKGLDVAQPDPKPQSFRCLIHKVA